MDKEISIGELPDGFLNALEEWAKSFDEQLYKMKETIAPAFKDLISVFDRNISKNMSDIDSDLIILRNEKNKYCQRLSCSNISRKERQDLVKKIEYIDQCKAILIQIKSGDININIGYNLINPILKHLGIYI